MYGWESEDAVEKARKQVTERAGVAPTSGGTCLSAAAWHAEPMRPRSAVPRRTPLVGARCDIPSAVAAGAHPHTAPAHARHPSLQVADLIGADPKEIIFTSGATETNNRAIKGDAGFYKDKKRHVITTQTEHKCVLDSCR